MLTLRGFCFVFVWLFFQFDKPGLAGVTDFKQFFKL